MKPFHTLPVHVVGVKASMEIIQKLRSATPADDEDRKRRHVKVVESQVSGKQDLQAN